METRNDGRNTTRRFEMLAYNPIDCESFEGKLRVKRTSDIQRYEGERTLTPTPAAKASFHEPDVSINLAHSVASFRASSCTPLPTHALLHFISRPCGKAGSSDNTAEYCEMASSYWLASTALSPRSSSSLRQRYLKSDKRWSLRRGSHCKGRQNIS